jgi:hypothetical protein
MHRRVERNYARVPSQDRIHVIARLNTLRLLGLMGNLGAVRSRCLHAGAGPSVAFESMPLGQGLVGYRPVAASTGRERGLPTRNGRWRCT